VVAAYSIGASLLTFGIQKANSNAAITAQTNGVSIALDTSMTKFLKAFAISALLLAPASIANAEVTFGIRIGEPPAPRYYRVPAQPGPNYEWIEGYWAPARGRYVWHDGYWARPPYAGAYWVAPYYSGGRYFAGRWEGSRERHHRHDGQIGDRDRRSNYDRR
jgi:hypothetical protein